MRWPLTAYANRELALSVVIFGGATALALWQLPAAAPVPALLLAFALAFFRDPERRPPEGDHKVLSPADGRVVDIQELVEDQFLRGPAVRIGIFMSLWNVHVNRAPLSGRALYRDHRPGRFHSALSPAASRDNECLLLGLETRDGTRLLVKQIAGVLARRIVCAWRVGDERERGERFGMVKLGSRLEVYVPRSASFQLRVAVGDRVQAGQSVLGLIGGGQGAKA